MKKILVTGGTGAVGKYIVDDLVQHGYTVGVLDLAAPARGDVVHHAVRGQRVLPTKSVINPQW
ncbi:MAG: NAD(P)-dependent oxidoreductase [Curvibacter sp.]|nr:MAG: NAD(P)-dependent oxidoreductase [Curvibacter sp.]